MKVKIPPKVTASAFNKIMSIGGKKCLRVAVEGGGCSGFQYEISMDSDIKEDIVLNSVDNLPAEELQVINNPIPIKETEYASNDIAETEKQALSPTTETSINNVPDYIDQGSLNNEFS